MRIGCAKEIKNNEFRVGLTPDNVKAYISNGHEVFIEKKNTLMQEQGLLIQLRKSGKFLT